MRARWREEGETASFALREDNEMGGCWSEMLGEEGGETGSLQMEKGMSSRTTDPLVPSAQDNVPKFSNEISL